jgi:hypothetical protein
MLTYITALPSRRTSGRGALNWLLDIDAAWRGSRHLRDLPDSQLADVGMTRADAEGAYWPGSR